MSLLSSCLYAHAAPQIGILLGTNALTNALSTADFGTAPVGTFVTNSFTITNSGDANLNLTSVDVMGTNATEFIASAPNTNVVAPASSTTLRVVFAPASDGDKSATLVLTDNDPSESTFAFQLTGGTRNHIITEIPDAGDLPHTAQLTTNGDRLDKIIGSLTDGNDVDMYRIHISNSMAFTATVTSFPGDSTMWLVDLDGNYVTSDDDSTTLLSHIGYDYANWPAITNGDYFLAIAGLGNEPRDSSDTPLAVDLGYGYNGNSNGAGPLFTWVNTGGDEFGDYTIAVTGASFSTAVPEISVQQPAGHELTNATAAIDFGSTSINTFTDKTFIIENTGAADLAINSVTLTGPDAAQFVIATNSAPSVYWLGGASALTIRYLPTSKGSKTATLHIGSDDADENPFNISLSGISTNFAPVLTLPASPVIVEVADPSGAIVTFTVTANDAEDGPLTPNVTPASGSLFPLGTNVVTATATDSTGETITNTFQVIVRDTITLAPFLIAPANNTTSAVPLVVSFSLPEAAAAGSVKLAFSNTTSFITLTLADSQGAAGPHSFSFIPGNPGGSPQIAGVSGGTGIPDGTYKVTLSYQDAFSNPAATATATNLLIDTLTLAPLFLAPANNTASTVPFLISFSLPETAAPGSVKLLFTNATSFITLILADPQGTAGPHSFSFIPGNPGGSAQIAGVSGGTGIPDGAYKVTLSYQDALANPAASATATNVRIDTLTLAPSLITPSNNAGFSSPFPISFSLPEDAAPGSVRLVFSNPASTNTLTLANSQGAAGSHNFSFNPGNPVAAPQIAGVSGGSAIPDGHYSVILSYQDSLANPAASATSTGVLIDTTPPVITVPGTLRAGTLGTGANLSFSVSALDLVDGAVPATAIPASGSFFPIGSNTVTVTAADARGNMATNTFQVILSGPPSLHITNLGNNVIVYWKDESGWNLREATNLATANSNWISSAGVALTGGTNYLMLTNAPANHFYRLSFP